MAKSRIKRAPVSYGAHQPQSLLDDGNVVWLCWTWRQSRITPFQSVVAARNSNIQKLTQAMVLIV
jgi:hypothetical protein